MKTDLASTPESSLSRVVYVTIQNSCSGKVCMALGLWPLLERQYFLGEAPSPQFPRDRKDSQDENAIHPGSQRCQVRHESTGTAREEEPGRRKVGLCLEVGSSGGLRSETRQRHRGTEADSKRALRARKVSGIPVYRTTPRTSDSLPSRRSLTLSSVHENAGADLHDRQLSGYAAQNRNWDCSSHPRDWQSSLQNVKASLRHRDNGRGWVFIVDIHIYIYVDI